MLRKMKLALTRQRDRWRKWRQLDLENRGRRKNLCIFGLKEGVVGEQTLLNFVTDMLPKWLGLPPEKTFTLERVHCTLANGNRKTELKQSGAGSLSKFPREGICILGGKEIRNQAWWCQDHISSRPLRRDGTHSMGVSSGYNAVCWHERFPWILTQPLRD